MDPVELREEGLLLRPWGPDDAAEVYQACQDPSMPRRLRAHALASVAGPAEARTATDDVSLGVFDASTGTLVGTCGLVRIDPAVGQAELGYWTAPPARGRGVATSAARAIVRYAVGTLGVRRVLWRAKVGNHASRLVAVRIGVRFEGIERASLPDGDGWADAWTGALLPGELREPGTEPDPALERAAARCRVFGRPQPTLQTVTRDGRPVRLRPLRPEDVPACVRACRDPDTVRYTTVPDPYDETHAERFILSDAPALWARGTEAVFAVADADDAMVGTISLRLHGDELFTPTGDVGYLIGPWARGRGYASAALRALTDWGFANLALRRIEWQAYVGNAASRAVAERAGFRIEGVRRQALQHRGTFRDTWSGARIAGDQS
jgi:RimJ/RimL family protein N-acetyltransferase